MTEFLQICEGIQQAESAEGRFNLLKARDMGYQRMFGSQKWALQDTVTPQSSGVAPAESGETRSPRVLATSVTQLAEWHAAHLTAQI